MLDYSESAREELKRVDHLVYVSLKYTRTVDVIKSILDRLISTIDFLISDLLEHKDEEVESIPEPPAGKAKLVRDLYSDDPDIGEMIDFYLHLRKLSRAEYTKINEYRRHVAMIVKEEGEELYVNIDLVTEYYAKTKKYWENIEKRIGGINE